MAYKMKNGTGPNALPLLALIPPAIAAAKGLIGAGVVAGGAKAAAAGAAIAKAAGAVGGAVGGAAQAVGGAVGGAVGNVGGAAGAVGGKVGAGAAKVGAGAAKVAGKVGGAVGKAAGKVGAEVGKEGFKALVKDAGKGILKSTLAQAPVTAKQKIEENQALKQQEQELFKSKFSPSMMGDVKGPNMEKSRKKVEQRSGKQSERKEGGGKLREIGKKIVERKEARRAERQSERKEGGAKAAAAGAERQSERQNKGQSAPTPEAQSAPTPEAPSMMGYNPISKHMGGRGASMYGGPMMKGGENVIVRDAKSGGKNQYNKRGK